MNDRRSLRPLVQMAVIHYQFEAIHPFGDGNGRFGRLLMGLFLNERNLLPQPLLYLSAYFERTRQGYYDGLMRVSTHGDCDSWLQYVLEGVRVQADAAIGLADRLQRLSAVYRTKLHEVRATGTSLGLVDHLFVSPYVTARSVQDSLGVSAPTARSSIKALCELAILTEFDPERKWGKAYWAPEIYSLIRADDADDEAV